MSATEDPHALPRAFGLGTATFVVISSMVGTGVLTTSGFTMYFNQSNQLMLLLWVVGGVVALCGALSLAELAAALPHTGGDYVFLHHAYGPLVAFLSGWVSFLIGFGAPIATSGFAAAKYLTGPFPALGADPILVQRVVATVLIPCLTALHLLHQSVSRRVQAVTTVIKLVVLFLLAAAGIAAGHGQTANLLDAPPSLSGNQFTTLLFSLVYIAYAYTGWNGAAYIAGEIDRPDRMLPRAILLGTGLVIVLYLALNAMYALALPVASVRQIVDDPANRLGTDAVAPIAEIAARQLFGPRVSGVLSIAIGLTMVASLSAFILTGPRVAYAMARAGHFPALAARVSPAGIPTTATYLQVAWALVLLWSGRLDAIVVYAGLGLSLFSMLTVAAVYVLRHRRPDLPRPFRTPGYPLTPAVFLLVTAALSAATFSERPMVSLLSLASILAGIPVYVTGRLLARRLAR